MDESNPYEAPRSEIPPSARPRGSGVNGDRALAARLLQLRELGGYRPGLFLRGNARQYVFRCLVLAGLVMLAVITKGDPRVVVLVGMVLGGFGRDAQWFLGIRRGWPFTLKVTDWAKVRALADGDPAAE